MSSTTIDNLLLSTFNPNSIEFKRNHGHPPIILCVAKRGNGKSTLIADIVSYLRVPVAIVMSGTEGANHFYSNYIHPLFIYYKYESEKLGKILRTQKMKAEYLDQKYKKKLADIPSQHILIIMDDLNYDTKLMKDPYLLEVFLNGRHYGITLIMAFQYLMNIPPIFRTNSDYIFAGRDITIDYMEKLQRYFFGMVNKKDFVTIFKKYTQNYTYLVLDKNSKSDVLKDTIFWYRANPRKNYKIGSPKDWEEWSAKLKQE